MVVVALIAGAGLVFLLQAVGGGAAGDHPLRRVPPVRPVPTAQPRAPIDTTLEQRRAARHAKAVARRRAQARAARPTPAPTVVAPPTRTNTTTTPQQTFTQPQKQQQNTTPQQQAPTQTTPTPAPKPKPKGGTFDDSG
jgi:outer membrane biosynthesis protein TonB